MLSGVFAQNKGSLVAGVIIMFYSFSPVITPFVSGQMDHHKRPNLITLIATPKNPLFAGTGFWDGPPETGTSRFKKYIQLYETGVDFFGHNGIPNTTEIFGRLLHHSLRYLYQRAIAQIFRRSRIQTKLVALR